MSFNTGQPHAALRRVKYRACRDAEILTPAAVLEITHPKVRIRAGWC